jgi:hypothetical protein
VYSNYGLNTVKTVVHTCDICKKEVPEILELFLTCYDKAAGEIVSVVEICHVCVIDLSPDTPQPTKTLLEVIKEFFRKH